MCYTESRNAILPSRACFISQRALTVIVAVCVALSILATASCATMTQPQKEAAWRTLARNAGAMATAFSPEAKAFIEVACNLRWHGNEGSLREIWTQLDSCQASAISQMINDVVTLAQSSMSQDARDREAFYGSILDAICLGASVAR